MGLKVVEGSKAAITIRGCLLGGFIAFLLLLSMSYASRSRPEDTFEFKPFRPDVQTMTLTLNNHVKYDAAACLDLQTSSDNSDRYTPDPTSEERSCLRYITPSDYIELLMKVLVGVPSQGATDIQNGQLKQVPYHATLRKYGNDWPTHGFTMIGTVRLENFRAAILEVYRNLINIVPT
jgi:hypothetical protein